MVLHEQIFRELLKDLGRLKDRAKTVFRAKQLAQDARKELAKKNTEVDRIKAQLAAIEEKAKKSTVYVDEMKRIRNIEEVRRQKVQELESKLQDRDVALRATQYHEEEFMQTEDDERVESIQQEIEELQRQKAILQQQGFEILSSQDVENLLATEPDIIECLDSAFKAVEEIKAVEDPELEKWVEEQRQELSQKVTTAQLEFTDSTRQLRVLMERWQKLEMQRPPIVDNREEFARIDCHCGRRHPGFCNSSEETDPLNSSEDKLVPPPLPTRDSNSYLISE